jgi:hypothetical protein
VATAGVIRPISGHRADLFALGYLVEQFRQDRTVAIAAGGIGIERVLTRGKWCTVEVLACPVTWRPHPEQIASARRGYDDWWQALDWVRDGLLAGGMMREVEVTSAMPKMQPWLISQRK